MRVLGIDYGDSRVGVAVSDPLGITAQGVTTLLNRMYDKMLESLLKIIDEYKINKIVLGMPKNMNGTSGERSEVTQRFCEDLKSHCGDIPIVLWDERLTTVQAVGILNTTNTRGKNRKKVIDTVAACIILQSYLDYSKGE